jgi:hypothetical protein
MPEPAADEIVRNLIEALERLREDLDRMELWTAALERFHRPKTGAASANVIAHFNLLHSDCV